MDRSTDWRRSIGGVIGVVAALVGLVGALVPWRNIYECWERCFADSGGTWNVFQVGGSSPSPSSYTYAGLLIVLGAALLGASSIVALSSSAPPWTKRGVEAMAAGSVAIVAGVLVAPVPRSFEVPAAHGFFSSTPSVGPWMCALSGLLGLIATGFAFHWGTSTQARSDYAEVAPPGSI